MKIHQGDTVVVIAGKDRGKKGTVLRVLSEKNRVVVGGVNMRVKHVKKTMNGAGSRIQFEASLHVSNVMLADPKTGKPTRVGFKLDEKGNKARIAKKSGMVIEKGKIKQESKKQEATEKSTTATKSTTTEKSTKKKKEETTATQAPKKAPFWKKVGFGSDAAADASAGDGKTQADSGSIATPQHSRSGSRGS